MKLQTLLLLIFFSSTSTICAFLPIIIIQTRPHTIRSCRSTSSSSILASEGSVLHAKKPKSLDNEPPSPPPRNPFEAFLPSKEADDEKVRQDQDKGFSFRGLFKRDKDEQAGKDKAKKQQQQSQKKKQPSSSSRSKLKKEKRQEKKSKVDRKEDEEEEKDSILARVTSIFSKKDDDSQKEESKSKDTSNNNSNNPLGTIAQKVLSSSASLITTITQEEKAASQEEQWITVFPKTRISPGELVPVTVAGIDLLVIASKDARRLYCIANSCPHLGTPLETGTLVRLPTTIPSESSSSFDPFMTGSGSSGVTSSSTDSILTETDVANILQQDGCEDCIVCPLHRTAFALQSGQVRGEWCPYPPVIGKMMGTVKRPTAAAVFDIRTRGKNVQVRINSPLTTEPNQKKKNLWE